MLQHLYYNISCQHQLTKSNPLVDCICLALLSWLTANIHNRSHSLLVDHTSLLSTTNLHIILYNRFAGALSHSL